jgi:hypothetical protein
VSQFEFLLGLILVNELQDIGHVPEPRRKIRRHGRGHTESFMHAGEVIPHKIEGEGMTVIFKLLTFPTFDFSEYLCAFLVDTL